MTGRISVPISRSHLLLQAIPQTRDHVLMLGLGQGEARMLQVRIEVQQAIKQARISAM